MLVSDLVFFPVSYKDRIGHVENCLRFAGILGQILSVRRFKFI